MGTIKKILEQEGRAVGQVEHDTPVARCAEELMNRKVGALVILKEGIMAGIFTYHDLIQTVVKHAGELDTLPVSEVMTPEPITVLEDADLRETEELMLRKHIHHVPVIRNGDVIGIVDLVDILKCRFDECQVLTSDLEAYIEAVYRR